MTAGLSFVLGVDRYGTGRDTVRALARQTIADRVELVLAGPSGLAHDPEDTGALHSVRVVEAPLDPLTSAQAVGVAAASAPIVMIGETHAFPEPDCLERILAAFRDERVEGVAPSVANGNPRTARSWANLLVTYGNWIGRPAGQIDQMASHNAAFRREALLAFGPDLAGLLENGGGADRRLRAAGGTLLFVPEARLQHLNVSRPRGWLADRYWAARAFGVARSREWSASRRAAYCAGAPLIPVVFLARVFRSPAWASLRGELPRGVTPALVVSVLAITAGEVSGYAVGLGRTHSRLLEYELHRARYC